MFRGRPIGIFATLFCFGLVLVFSGDNVRDRWTAVDSLLARRVIDDEGHRDGSGG